MLSKVLKRTILKFQYAPRKKVLCKPSVVQHAATPETLPKPPVADPVQKDNVCGTKEPPTPSTSQDYDPSNVSPIKNFLKELSIEDSQLLTEEVVVHEDFMSHLNSLSSEYILFKEEETTRKSTQKFEKASSQTKKDIDNVHVKLKSVEELLKGISGLVLDRNKLLLPSGMETLRLKREAVLKAVCAMNPVIELLKNTQRKLRVLKKHIHIVPRCVCEIAFAISGNSPFIILSKIFS